LPKIGCHGIHTNTFHLVKKIVQIGPVDPEIALLKLKKGTTEGKIYSPVGKFSKRTKTDFYCLQNVRKPENEKYRSPNKHCKTHDIFLKDKTRFDRTATQK